MSATHPKSCGVRCLCGLVHRVRADQPTHCTCGIDLSIECPPDHRWIGYIPYTEMDDSTPPGRTPNGQRALYTMAAVVGP